jgi:hypothetical protein
MDQLYWRQGLTARRRFFALSSRPAQFQSAGFYHLLEQVFPIANATLPPDPEDFVRQTIKNKFNVNLKMTYSMVEGNGRYNNSTCGSLPTIRGISSFRAV